MLNKKVMGMITVLVLMAVLMMGCQSRTSNLDDEMSSKNQMVKEEMAKENVDNTEEIISAEMGDSEPMMEESPMNEGPMAPDFSLVDLEANTINLSDLKGEKVYLKFWASWCPICVSGLEEIDTLSGQMNDFKVLTIVSPDFNGEYNEEDFKEWFEAKGTESMVVLLDHDGKFAREYGVRGYPTSSFIGTDGVLVGQFPGHISNEQIEAAFQEVK